MNGEGGREWESFGREDGEKSRVPADPQAAIRAAYAAWTGRESLQPERLVLFDRQVARLASGEDLEAWTHPRSGAVVPREDRPRMFELGLHHLRDGTSHTIRGGVMYAVAKLYRTSPPIRGTEHAAVMERERGEAHPSRLASPVARRLSFTTVGEILHTRDVFDAPEADPVEQWEQDHPDECAELRDRIARELADEVRGRSISERTLRVVARTQYQHAVLQKIRAAPSAPAA